MNKMTPEELEKLIHRELQSLPTRRAPRTLEARVLAALEQQALIPWYHQSWSYWPAAVRVIFLAVAAAVAAAVLTGGFLLIQGFDSSALVTEVSQRLDYFTKLYALAQWMGNVSAQLVGTIPSLWLWGSVAAFMALNAAFFGLGAAAYRTLYRKN